MLCSERLEYVSDTSLAAAPAVTKSDDVSADTDKIPAQILLAFLFIIYLSFFSCGITA